MDQHNNQNKVASVQPTAKKVGELQEFQTLLKTYAYIH